MHSNIIVIIRMVVNKYFENVYIYNTSDEFLLVLRLEPSPCMTMPWHDTKKKKSDK